MTETLTKLLQVKSRTGKQGRQSCDWNAVRIYQSQRLFGQRLHSFSSHISSVPDPVVTSAFVIYFLSFVTFTGLAFQVCASPFVNNWWWSATCWESKAVTGVWAAGTRWQLALTWHTNTHSHTYIWRYESHWLFPHSLPLSLPSLPPSQEIVSNNNERWVLEVRYCSYDENQTSSLCTVVYLSCVRAGSYCSLTSLLVSGLVLVLKKVKFMPHNDNCKTLHTKNK